VLLNKEADRTLLQSPPRYIGIIVHVPTDNRFTYHSNVTA